MKAFYVISLFIVMLNLPRQPPGQNQFFLFRVFSVFRGIISRKAKIQSAPYSFNLRYLMRVGVMSPSRFFLFSSYSEYEPSKK